MEIVEQGAYQPDIVKGINPDFDTSSSFRVIDRSRAGMIAMFAFFFWLASIFFIVLVPGMFLLPYLASLNLTLTEPDQLIEFAKSDPTAVVLQIVGIIPAHLLTLLLAWLLVTWGRKYSFFDSLGWKKGGFRWWHYLMILGGFAIVTAIVGMFLKEQDNDLLKILRSSRSAVYIVAIVATFTAPLVEEVIYRGILYSGFERVMGVPAAFVLVTCLFAAVHVPQYYPSYATIIMLTLLSMTLTAVRVKTNNLLPCVILHTVFNGIQSVLLVLEPLITTPDVQQQSASIFRLLN